MHSEYGEDGHWLGDYDVNGSAIQQVIWFDGLPVAVLAKIGNTLKLHYIEADALGTPRAVIDPVRNVAVWRWALTDEAFGESAPSVDPDNDGHWFVFDMRYPGQQYDSATGLSYNYFRDYDPSTGRYVQSDPIGLDGGISTYGYANGSPTMYSDPEGLAAGFVFRMGIRFVFPRLGARASANVAASYATRLAARRAAMSAARAQAPVARPAFRGEILTAESAACNAGSGSAAASSSKALGQALEAAGYARPAGSAAHHIVAGNARKAASARIPLQRFGVGINQAQNGVFLSESVHARIHTNAYYEAVNNAMAQATTREHALEVLNAIRQAILSGRFP